MKKYVKTYELLLWYSRGHRKIFKISFSGSYVVQRLGMFGMLVTFVCRKGIGKGVVSGYIKSSAKILAPNFLSLH